MKRFAKLIEFHDRQILVFLEPDVKKDYILHQISFVERLGCSVDVTASFNVPYDAFDPYVKMIDGYDEGQVADAYELFTRLEAGDVNVGDLT